MPLDNYYYRSYIAFLAKIETETKENKKCDMALLTGEKKIFFHLRQKHNMPSEFIKDMEASAKFSQQPIIKYFNGNKLVFEIDISKPGYVTWLDNYDPGWALKIDGKNADIQKLFDTFKTAQLSKPGKHIVEFSYFPYAPSWAYFIFAFGIIFFIAVIVLL